MNPSETAVKLFKLVEQDMYGNVHALIDNDYYHKFGAKCTFEGNPFVCTSYTTDFIKCVQELKTFVKTADLKNPKAVFVKGASNVLVDYYNLNVPETENCKFQGYTVENQSVYLIKNGANCPELIEGQVYAGGLTTVVKHEQNYYFLVVKDKFNKRSDCFTMPRGGVEYLDYVKFKNNDYLYKITAERELEEESDDCDGSSLRLSTKNLFVKIKFVFPVKFASKNTKGIENYFDNFGACANFINYQHGDHKFLDKLFDSKNLDPLKNYVLKFDNNKETEFFCAVPLDVSNLKNIKSVNDLEYFYKNIPLPTIKLGDESKTILKYDILTAYLYLLKVLNFEVDNISLCDKTTLNNMFNNPFINGYHIVDHCF